MKTSTNQPDRAEGAADKGQGRTCACMDDHPVYCTSYRYSESPEKVRYNGDECQCICHHSDEDGVDDDY